MVDLPDIRLPELRIFVADDHPIVREGLKLLIDDAPDMTIVGEASDGRAALEGINRTRPDVVLMDVSMPEMDGEEATRRIAEHWPAIKVVALTVHQDAGYARALLEAGAAGFIVKDALTEELVRAIRIVAAGGPAGGRPRSPPAAPPTSRTARRTSSGASPRATRTRRSPAASA